MAEYPPRPVRTGRRLTNRLRRAAGAGAAAALLGSLVGAGLGVVMRWRRRYTGNAIALDLSPMVARPGGLVVDQSRCGSGWPTGVQEDDDVRWRWDASPDLVSREDASAAFSLTSSVTRSGKGHRE